MSVQTYRKGECSSGFVGCRVVVGSSCDEKITRKYVKFKKSWAFTEREAYRLESKLKKDYGFIEGKTQRISLKKQQPKGDPAMATTIRGVSLSKKIKVNRFQNGNVSKYVGIQINLNIYSIKEKRRIDISRSSKDYKVFLNKWDEIVDFAVEHYQLTRAKKGWRKPPISEAVFYKKLAEIEKKKIR